MSKVTNDTERHELKPVVLTIFALTTAIIVFGYVVGNAIA